MATITNKPGTLNIETTRDDFSALVDFGIVLTGYTFEAVIIHKNSDNTTPITVTNTSLADGQITLSVQDTALALVPYDKHDWYLCWTDGSGNKRKVLAGTFEVIK